MAADEVALTQEQEAIRAECLVLARKMSSARTAIRVTEGRHISAAYRTCVSPDEARERDVLRYGAPIGATATEALQGLLNAMRRRARISSAPPRG